MRVYIYIHSWVQVVVPKDHNRSTSTSFLQIIHGFSSNIDQFWRQANLRTLDFFTKKNPSDSGEEVTFSVMRINHWICTRRIIPRTRKWLITMVIVSPPKDRVVGPLPNGLLFHYIPWLINGGPHPNHVSSVHEPSVRTGCQEKNEDICWVGTSWRIIPVSKWLITTVSKFPIFQMG